MLKSRVIQGFWHIRRIFFDETQEHRMDVGFHPEPLYPPRLEWLWALGESSDGTEPPLGLRESSVETEPPLANLVGKDSFITSTTVSQRDNKGRAAVRNATSSEIISDSVLL